MVLSELSDQESVGVQVRFNSDGIGEKCVIWIATLEFTYRLYAPQWEPFLCKFKQNNFMNNCIFWGDVYMFLRKKLVKH